MSPEASARLGRWVAWLDRDEVDDQRATFELAMQAWERGDEPPEGRNVLHELPDPGSRWKNPAGHDCEVVQFDIGPLDVGSKIVHRTRIHVLFPGPPEALLVIGRDEFEKHYTKA